MRIFKRGDKPATVTESTSELGHGDVPLFVEHCEAVAAEVDVTLR